MAGLGRGGTPHAAGTAGATFGLVSIGGCVGEVVAPPFCRGSEGGRGRGGWLVGGLDAADGHVYYVVGLDGFFDDEGFAVFDSDQVAIEAGDGGDALFDFLLGREEI